MQMKMRSKMPASRGQHPRSHNSSINRLTTYYPISFWKVINGVFIAAKLKAMTLIYRLALITLLTICVTLTIGGFYQSREAYIASPIFFAFEF